MRASRRLRHDTRRTSMAKVLPGHGQPVIRRRLALEVVHDCLIRPRGSRQLDLAADSPSVL